MAVVILAGDTRRERSQLDGRCVGHPNLGAPGRKPVCDGVDSPRPLPKHDGMREDLGVKPGSARSDCPPWRRGGATPPEPVGVRW